MANTSKIVEKVRDLLALSKSSNEHEAAAAAAAAERLISKYQLDEAEINASPESEEQRPDEFPEPIYVSSRRTAWRSNLACALARHYDCAVYIQTGYSGDTKRNRTSRYKLVGRSEDCQLAIFMFNWISAEVDKLAGWNAKGRGYEFSQSYCEGVVHGVLLKMREERETAKQAATSAALVVLDNRAKEADVALAKLHAKLNPSAALGSGRKDAEAYFSGVRDGRAMHLGAGLPSGGAAAKGQLSEG
jgi:hypothetical protein